MCEDGQQRLIVPASAISSSVQSERILLAEKTLDEHSCMLREGCEVDAEQRATYCFKTSPATCLKRLIFGIIFERIFAITIQTPCWCPALHGTLLGFVFYCV